MASKILQPTKYISTGAQNCPNCRSGGITAGESNFDGLSATVSVTCDHCGATWDDVYTLTTYENLEIPE